VFRQVLVPIDGSPGAERLVRGAAGAAGRLDATLLLWGVLRPGTARRSMERHLHELLVGSADGHGAFMAVDAGDPVEHLLEHTEQASNALVCVTSHGQGRIGEDAIGCITPEWLRRSHTPTLVFGPGVDDTTVRATGWKRVMACVDASERGERALETTAGFARATGLHLTVVQAVDADDEVFDHERSRHYVEALAHSVKPAACARVIDGTGQPARALSTEANLEAGTILAVASRGRGGTGGLLESGSGLGSVTNELIRLSNGPVLVIPAAHELVGAAAGAMTAW